MKTAVLAGATGLIGKQLLELLLHDPYYTSVKAITRTPLEQNHEKLNNLVFNFDRLTEYSDALKADHVFCCLGTTMKKARTKEAFRKVDFDYPVELARLTKASGATQYLLVSALGADKKSSIFYNQVKGEVEESIGTLQFDGYHVFRPSLLLGPRSEQRSAEDAAKVFYRIFGFLIPRKYKAIHGATVARAMLHFAKQEQSGTFIHESVELQHF